MKHILLIILSLSLTLAAPAQQKRKATTPAAKSTTTRKQTATRKKTAQPQSVEQLKSQRQQIQQQIKVQEQRLRSNQQNVRKRLRNLMMLNNEIEGKRRTLQSIRDEIDSLDVEIGQLEAELHELQEELAACKDRYVKSMRYMHRNKSQQSQLMFIFSADNMTQMFRRIRFMRDYAAYQRVQGEEVKLQQKAIDLKLEEINLAREDKLMLLSKEEQEERSLEGKQTEQQNVVKSLQQEQRTIQTLIAQQKKKDAALNEQIDRLIAAEVARQKARAAAEAKRRAEAEAAKRKAAEQAKKKSEKAPTESPKQVASTRKEPEAPMHEPTEDQRISGSFESNQGRLPMPITGSYRIVSHFGQYNVDGLTGVTLDNKGINIMGQQGCQARSIFDGEVSAVFSFGGTMVVMVRHGSYISVYCNLASVSVQRGQKVATRQSLGRVAADNVLQFQLRRETTKLNPEKWLAK